jgi:hypothetical protein
MYESIRTCSHTLQPPLVVSVSGWGSCIHTHTHTFWHPAASHVSGWGSRMHTAHIYLRTHTYITYICTHTCMHACIDQYIAATSSTFGYGSRKHTIRQHTHTHTYAHTYTNILQPPATFLVGTLHTTRATCGRSRAYPPSLKTQTVLALNTTCHGHTLLYMLGPACALL